MICFTFINGQYRADLSNPGELSNHIIDSDAFTLHIPKNFRTQQPIHLKHVNQNSQDQMQHINHRIVADTNAEVVVMGSYEGDDSLTYTNNIETHVDLKSGSCVHFYKCQKESEQASHRAQFSAKQAENSYLGTYHVVKGSNLSQDTFSYLLSGEGATCESIGFYQADKQQRFEVNSHIQHLNSHTKSRQWYKGMADDKSHVKFNGMVKVDQDAKKISAEQKNNNLLLSTQAQIDTRPELEIYSEDVRCSHGATLGQLDEAALFYLRSRGIDHSEARTLLTTGFADEIFAVFPDQIIASRMRGVL